MEEITQPRNPAFGAEKLGQSERVLARTVALGWREATGLSLSDAAQYASLEADPGAWLDRSALTENDWQELDALRGEISALVELGLRLGQTDPDTDALPESAGILPSKDIEAVREWARANPTAIGKPGTPVGNMIMGAGAGGELFPGVTQRDKRRRELEERARMSPERARETLARALGDRPPLSDWIAANVLPGPLEPDVLLRLVWRELERQRAEEAEQRARKAEQRAEDAEAEQRRLQTLHQVRDIPTHTRYPQIFIDNAIATREDWQNRLAGLDRYEREQRLEEGPGGRSVFEREARINAEPEHWDLSTSEWRLLHAVYTRYTQLGQDGQAYAGEYVLEELPALYAAAGIPEREDSRGRRGDFSHKRREEIQEAIRTLARDPRVPGSGRLVPVFVARRQPLTARQKRGEERWTMAAEEMYILQRVPVWSDRTEDEMQDIRSLPPEEWPEPDQWALKLPRALRVGLNDYFRLMPADLPYRLERAAKEIQKRSKNAGVRSRDWTFCLWLYKQRLQPTGKGAEVRWLVYADRGDLAKRIPSLRTYQDAGQKGRVDKYTAETYETAKRAGLLLGYRLGVPGRKGSRDVLELNPQMFPQIAAGELVLQDGGEG